MKTINNYNKLKVSQIISKRVALVGLSTLYSKYCHLSSYYVQRRLSVRAGNLLKKLIGTEGNLLRNLGCRR